jgi:hypothetical protein
MSWKRLTLLALFYVVADFSSPLVPGAVGFSDQTIEAVRGSRSHLDEPRASGLARRSGSAVERVATTSRWRPGVPGPRGPVERWLAPVKRTALTPGAGPAAVEDH